MTSFRSKNLTFLSLGAFLLLLAVTQLNLVLAASSDGSCSASNQCPSSAPCCSEFGYCGTGSQSCLGGCNPDASFKPSSCKALPRCTNQYIDFTGKKTPYIPIASYKGDPEQAPMTLDQGVARPTTGGVRLALTRTGQAQQGTRLSTTRFWYYGRATAVMKHDSHAGVVHTFISMSNTRDEIDWEFTTANGKDAETNYYWYGQPEGYTHGYTIPESSLPGGSNFDVSAWHSYTIDWSPNRLKWEIDGVVVRTIKKSSTLGSDGFYHYPATPARLQLSIWGAGTDDYPEGTRSWSGGYIDWSKVDSKGSFTNMIKSLEITCADPSTLGAGHAYSFSSKIDPTTGEKKVISTQRSTTL
ncbi:concanavalin A-like lectin/glucanase [Violaceomyces palustris]|uniref:Concanavalin A-like lectin/glucanase n=1 Tax=Violaceomyces palustris TaxID=1673888 RepID=A0ACD0P0G5_9BASI|nr:concanavalin A-like lectin/glucanase [Violaceomyces palustris]